MNSGVRRLDLRADPDADLSEVVRHIREGGVVTYPTETVYGLGAACTTLGVAAVRTLKGRADARPFIALVPSIDHVERLGWTPAARELASIFWPGALTLVLGDPEGCFPAGIRSATTGTVAVRVTSHPVAARLVGILDAPLISTSLNRPGETPVLSGADARALLQRMGADGVWLLDIGTLPASEASTVVDCSTGAEPFVLREGAIPVHRLRCAIPEIHEITTP